MFFLPNLHTRAVSTLLSLFIFALLTTTLCALVLTCTPSHAGDWWPIQVKSYYGNYDAKYKTPGQASKSLSGPILEEWIPPLRATKPYTLGVAFPHIKDPYWVAVNYGIIEEAKHLGVGIRLVEAGGYHELAKQHAQVRTLVSDKVDGIILGSISYEGNNQLIADMTKQGIPIVEVVNDVHAPSILAKAMVPFHEMGYYAGEFVAEDAEKSGLDTVKIIFLPGPKASGWAPDTLDGFQTAMDYFPGKVEIVDIRWGDTGLAEQGELIRAALSHSGPVDYVVGNAVAAEAASAILEEMGLTGKTSIVSTYIIPSLYDKIAKGFVAAAPSDLTVFQGRMAVDMLVRILNGEKPGTDFPFRSGPFIPMIVPANISSFPYEGLFGPRGYTPIFNLEPER